jgi:hypothetical protein
VRWSLTIGRGEVVRILSEKPGDLVISVRASYGVDGDGGVIVVGTTGGRSQNLLTITEGGIELHRIYGPIAEAFGFDRNAGIKLPVVKECFEDEDEDEDEESEEDEDVF